MNYKYYRSKGTTGKIIVDELNEAFEPILKARKELLDRYKADGLFMSGLFSDTPSALGFKEEQNNVKYLKYEGFFNGYHRYSPKNNTKLGKRLSRDLENESLQFSFSKFILERFELNCAVRNEDTDELFMPKAGLINDVIFLAIPTEDNSNDAVRIPVMFEEISEEEFNAHLSK